VNVHDAPYYEELQGRLRGLLTTVAHWLTTEEAALVGELIDANELGVSLEMMAEMLQGADARLDASIANEVADIAEQMGLPTSVVGNLRPQVR